MDDVDLNMLPRDAAVPMIQYGTCHICGALEDLRCEVCRCCFQYVQGCEVPGGHRLWDSRKPWNSWLVMTH